MGENNPKTNISLALGAAIFTAVVFMFLYFFIGINQKKNTYEDSKTIAKDISRRAANQTEEIFILAWRVARSIAAQAIIYHKEEANRENIVELVRSSLQISPHFLAVWTMWEPNSYDGKDMQYANQMYYDSDGNLSVTFFRHNDSVFLEFTEPDDYFDDYYTFPKKSKSELILEPYHYTYEGFPEVYYETTVVVPIIIDSVFMGVFAIDIDLSYLQQRINSVKIYDKGYLCVISYNGEIVSHFDSNFQYQNFFNLLNESDTITRSIIKDGREYSLETVSGFTGENVFRFFYPIRIGTGINPWSLMVEIPIKEATVRSKQLEMIGLVTLILGLSLIIYLVINIFDRKRFETKLIQSIIEIENNNRIIAERERNYREIFNSTNEAIFIHNPLDSAIIDVNDVACSMFGYSNKDEIIGLEISNLSSGVFGFSQVDAYNIIQKVLNQESSVFEWRSRKKNGDIFWSEVSLKKAYINGELRLLAVIRDISDKKNTAIELENYRNNLEKLVQDRTEELAAANEQLTAINDELIIQREELQVALNSLSEAQNKLVQTEKMASLGVLASGVAHEINNPLNFIYGGILALDNYLKKNLKQYHEEVNPMIDSIYEGVRRSTLIVRSLNQYSEADYNIYKLCDIHAIIENCLIILQVETKNRIAIEKNYYNLECIINCIEGKIQQSILNILTNSVQAIFGNGLITISTNTINNTLMVTISDSGCGISKDNLSKVFDPFFTTKDPGKGIGLGLFIAYNNIREHKGKIEIESELGHGTVARIIIPLIKE
jgi:PAS domain S-box-containing protein